MRTDPGTAATGLSIRSARNADLEPLVDLERSCFNRPWSRGILADELALDSSITLIATRAGRAVGYAIARALPDRDGTGIAELLRLGVLPEQRRQSIARELTLHLVERLRTSGVSTLQLEVREDNLAAQGLYRRLGFVEDGRRPGYYEDRASALLMSLELDPTSTAGESSEPVARVHPQCYARGQS